MISISGEGLVEVGEGGGGAQIPSGRMRRELEVRPSACVPPGRREKPAEVRKGVSREGTRRTRWSSDIMAGRREEGDNVELGESRNRVCVFQVLHS